jgi:predicted DNA-binding transcriptional regulator YafY
MGDVLCSAGGKGEEPFITPQKDRLLFLLELLNRETDEEHPITVAEIINRLNAGGFTATRKTVAKDIETLQAHDVDVICNRGRQNQHFIGDRIFELPELTLLVDAVQDAKFIPIKQSKKIIDKLSTLTSTHQADKLNRQLYVEKQVKSVNEKLLYTVNILQTAIQSKRKVDFQYFEYTATKKKIPKHGGKVYKFSPYALLWNNDSYYVLGFSDSHEKVVKFRVDRMDTPEETKEKAVAKSKDFRVEEYAKSVFQMFDDETRIVTLRCENAVMKSIIDRFGVKTKATVVNEKRFIAEVEVSVSPTFFGWVVGFGGKMEIIAPEDVRKRYKDLLQEIITKN